MKIPTYACCQIGLYLDILPPLRSQLFGESLTVPMRFKVQAHIVNQFWVWSWQTSDEADILDNRSPWRVSSYS